MDSLKVAYYNNFHWLVFFVAVALLLNSSNFANGQTREQSTDEDIFIVSPSHGDISIIDEGEEVRFTLLVSSLSPIEKVQVFRGRTKGSRQSNKPKKKGNDERTRDDNDAKFLKQIEITDTKWLIEIRFNPFTVECDTNKGKSYDFKEDCLLVVVKTKTGAGFNDFLFRSQSGGAYSYQPQQFENLPVETQPESELLEGSFFFPGLIGLRFNRNLTKAANDEQQVSGMGLFLAQSFIMNGNFPIGTYSFKYLFYNNYYSSIFNSDTEQLVGTYKQNGASAHNFNFSWLYNPGFVDIEVTPGFYLQGESLINPDPSKEEEIGNFISADAKYVHIGDTYKAHFGIGLTMLNREEASNESTGSNYVKTGPVLDQRFFFRANIWNVDFGLVQQNIENQTKGSYLQSTEDVLQSKIEIEFDRFDIRVRLAQHSTDFKNIRTAELYTDPIQLNRSIFGIGAVIKITKLLRLILETTLDSQDSEMNEFKYSDISYSASIGWADFPDFFSDN